MAKRITNVNYRQFLDEGIIRTLGEDIITKALENVKGKYTKQGRSLIIGHYYLGARPNEILKLKSPDVTKEKRYISVHLHGSKGGLHRTVLLPYKLPLVKEFYLYASSIHPDLFLFSNFRNNYIRSTINKKGEIKQRSEITGKLPYWFHKWFDNVIPEGITPYFLRHNRFSKLSEKGGTMEEIRQMKGARSLNSVYPYLHLSSKGAKSIAKRID